MACALLSLLLAGGGLAKTQPDEYAQYEEVLGHILHGDCLTPTEQANRDTDLIHTADERVSHYVQTGTRTETVKTGSHVERLNAGGNWL